MRVIIVGNGIAGNTAAESLLCAFPQAKITLFSEESIPEYSACVLCDYIAGELPKERVFLKSRKDYAALGIRQFLGRRVDIFDPVQKKVVVGRKDYPYDKLILAAGSEPIVPTIKGVNKKGVFFIKTMQDAETLLKHGGSKVVIVGSGPVGIEAAVALRKKGYEVHVIELLDWILPRLLDEESARVASDILSRNGVSILVGEKVHEIYGKRTVGGVVTDHREIPCDTVIVSAGMKPRKDLAERSGLAVGRNGGIKVNTKMETDFEDVYACGDCAELVTPGTDQGALSLLWYSAKQQGKIAGLNSAGAAGEYTAPINVISLRVFGTYIASVYHPFYSTNQRYERIEKKFRDLYCRILLDKGVIRSIQVVGKSDDLGLFFPFLKKEERIEKIKAFSNADEGASLYPWYGRIRHYFG